MFTLALLLALATVTLISTSIRAIRDGVQFGRLVERFESGVVDSTDLLRATEFARSRDDWQLLLRLAWDLSGPDRWPTVGAVADAAVSERPGEPRWRYAAGLARIRSGRASEALQYLAPDGDANNALRQRLRLLAAFEAEEPSGLPEGLAALAEDPAETGPLVRAVVAAERSPSVESLSLAWRETRLGAFGVNAGLQAAALNDRVTAAELMNELRQAQAVPSAEDQVASLYLALWLRDHEWLFAQVQGLSGEAATRPELTILYADALLHQGQMVQARDFYRELQATAPQLDPLVFLNAAAISSRLKDEDPAAVLRRGLRYYPRSAALRGELAAILTDQGERLAAGQVLGSALLVDPGPRHRDWLLARAILGSVTPLNRFEADLWQYINDNPDADVVARFLARFLHQRNDREGLRRLQARYPLDLAPWTRVLYLTDAIDDGNFATAETILTDYPAETWHYQANHSLFALRHLPLHEIEPIVAEFRRWFDRAVLSDTERRDAHLRLLLYEAELARLQGENERAVARVQEAQRLFPGRAGLEAYRSLIAPPQ